VSSFCFGFRFSLERCSPPAFPEVCLALFSCTAASPSPLAFLPRAHTGASPPLFLAPPRSLSPLPTSPTYVSLPVYDLWDSNRTPTPAPKTKERDSRRALAFLHLIFSSGAPRAGFARGLLRFLVRGAHPRFVRVGSWVSLVGAQHRCAPCPQDRRILDVLVFLCPCFSLWTPHAAGLFLSALGPALCTSRLQPMFIHVSTLRYVSYVSALPLPGRRSLVTGHVPKKSATEAAPLSRPLLSNYRSLISALPSAFDPTGGSPFISSSICSFRYTSELISYVASSNPCPCVIASVGHASTQYPQKIHRE